MLSPLDLVRTALHPSALPPLLRTAVTVADRTLRPTEGARANAEEALVALTERRAARRDAAAAGAHVNGPESWQPQGTASAVRHGVVLPAGDDELVASLTGYVLEGLVHGEHCVVLATDAHLRAVRSRLGTTGWSAEARRLLVGIDAEQALGQVLVDDEVDAEAFERLVATHVLPHEEHGVRVYGELVDLLAGRGALGQAMELEALWDRALCGRSFPLLCGYLLHPSDALARATVMTGHTHVHRTAA